MLCLTGQGVIYPSNVNALAIYILTRPCMLMHVQTFNQFLMHARQFVFINCK